MDHETFFEFGLQFIGRNNRGIFKVIKNSRKLQSDDYAVWTTSATFVHLKCNPGDILDSHLSCLKYGPQMKGINAFQNLSFVPLILSSSFCLHIATYSNHGG